MDRYEEKIKRVYHTTWFGRECYICQFITKKNNYIMKFTPLRSNSHR